MKWCDSPLPSLASKHLPMWGCSCVDFIFLLSLPYAHAFHGPSLLFPSPSLSFFLDLFLVFSWLLKRMTCCVRPAKVLLLRHTFLADTSPNPFSDHCTAIHTMAILSSGSSHFLRLHSCINLIPTAQVKPSHLCPASNAASSSTKLQNELPYPPHIHLWLLLLPNGDLSLRLPLALGFCSNWLT